MKKDIEKIIHNIDGTMSLEGISLTEEDKQRLRDIDEGKTTVAQEIDKLNKKYLAKEKI